MGRCVVIGVGSDIAPARLALVNTAVNEDDAVILVGFSVDALSALGRFARGVYRDLNVKVEQIPLNPRARLVDAVVGLRTLIEDHAPCSVVIGITGDRWLTTVLGFLAMALATVGVFDGLSVGRVFVMPVDKGEPIDWPTVPKLIDVNLVEYRVLKLICTGYHRAKEITEGYASKFSESISLQAIEKVLARLRARGLVNSEPIGKAYSYGVTELGRLIACKRQY
jgi:hypothetical protein